MAGAAVAVAGGIAPAYAQDTKPVEKVTVTGTRIPQKGLTSISPVTTISAQESKFQGANSAEQLINNLPSTLAADTAEQSNGATGTATIDLRGLGPTRTLVLMNGRRLTPSGIANNGTPLGDINTIPVALIERVEVLTGGASAVYGADAVAGVVNFILRKDFEGVEMTVQYGFADHSNDNTTIRSLIQGFANGNPVEFKVPDKHVDDGKVIDISGIMGANSADGKGNVTLYAQYRHADAILESQRDFSACALASTGNPVTKFTCSGSSNAAVGFFAAGNYPVGSPLTPPPQKATPSGNFANFVGATDNFNFAPFNYLQRPDERYLLGAMGRYELADDLEVYTELSVADDHTVAQIAPSGLFRGSALNDTGNYFVNCDNPFLLSGTAPNRPFDKLCGAGTVQNPFANQDPSVGPVEAFIPLGPSDNATVDIGRRFAEAGGRQDDLRHTSYRGVVGLKGTLDDTWDYDIMAQYGTTILAETYRNDVSLARIARSLQVVDADPGPGVTPVCKSVLDGSDLNCVPANIFAGGALSADAVNYLATPGFQRGSTEERIVSAAMNGEIGMASPWAESNIAIAFGGEYRFEKSTLEADVAFNSGDLAGQGGPTNDVGGHYDVWEGFAEVQIPLVEDAPFAKLIELNGGYRISDYDTAGLTHTYKYGAMWMPTEDIRIRGGFQRAVRAPNIVELFLPQGEGLIGDNDPCASTATAAPIYSAAQCANSGLSAAQYGVLSTPGGLFQCVSDQCGGFFGGNPNLKPEESDSITLGVVLTPTFFSGFTASVDYFKIELTDAIGTIPSDVILAGCMEDNNVDFCNRIHRAPGSGILFGAGFVDQLNTNTGGTTTDGIDIEANYKLDLDIIDLASYGLAFNFIATKLLSYDDQPLTGGDINECAGKFGRAACGLPRPEWRHKLRATWETPLDLDVSFAWRRIGEVTLFGAADPVNPSIPEYDYYDLALQFTATDNIMLRAGVNNVTDEDPPIIHGAVSGFAGGPYNANTYSTVYDSFGREVFVAMTTKF